MSTSIILLLFLAASACVFAQTPTPSCPTCAYGLPVTGLLESGLNVDLTGHVFLVSGISTQDGIGRAAAKLLRSTGATVIGFARSHWWGVENYAELQQLGIQYYRADVTDLKDLRRLRALIQLGGVRKLDAILNVAGTAYAGRMNDAHPEQLSYVTLTNAHGPFNVWSVFEDMLPLNGTFAFVSSSNAYFPSTVLPTYGASKRLLQELMTQLTWFNGPQSARPIRFIDIVPAATNTSFMEHVLRAYDPSFPEWDTKVINSTDFVLRTQGQNPVRPGQAFLYEYLYGAPAGRYTQRHVSAGPAAYGQFVFLATNVAQRDPQGDIDFLQPLYASGNVDPYAYGAN